MERIMCRESMVGIVARTVAATLLSGAAIAQSTVFSTNFDAGVPPELSGTTTTEFVQGYAGIGSASVFAGNFLRNKTGCPAAATTLTLTNLPPHTAVDVRFLLAIIDTWDGLQAPFGPDFFEVSVDGTTVFSESFKNAFGGGHPYNAPPGVLLVEATQLGFRATGVNDDDSGFDMGLEPAFSGIPHTSSSLVIQWIASGAGWQHTCAGGDQDESWAIDNLEVLLDCGASATYCNASTTSIAGCKAAIGSIGAPSVSSPAGFVLSSGSVPGGKIGICIFGNNGPASLPFGTLGGSICVQPPFVRSSAQFGGGTSGVCNGNYSFTLQDLINASPIVVAGAAINAEIWARDPANPDGFLLSDGLEFVVCP